MVAGSSQRLTQIERVMGTVVSFDVRVGGSLGDARAAVRRAAQSLQRVDEVFSTYRPGSAISRLGSGELALADAPAEVQEVLRRCERLRVETGGAFNARVTEQLDPSAFVKGWAVEGAVAHLTSAGLTNFCVTAGGDVACRGGALPAATWRIGIQHPTDSDAIAAVAEVRNQAVATSGAYERGDHIRVPGTGAAAYGLRSATVVGPGLGTADAYSTAAFA